MQLPFGALRYVIFCGIISAVQSWEDKHAVLVPQMLHGRHQMQQQQQQQWVSQPQGEQRHSFHGIRSQTSQARAIPITSHRQLTNSKSKTTRNSSSSSSNAKRRSLRSQQCDEESKSLCLDNPALADAAEILELSEMVTINKEEHLFTVLHPEDHTQELHDQCATAGGILIGTRRGVLPCVDSDGSHINMLVKNMFVCLASSCGTTSTLGSSNESNSSPIYTAVDLLKEIGAFYGLDCSSPPVEQQQQPDQQQGSHNNNTSNNVDGDSATASSIISISPIEERWQQCEEDYLRLMEQHPSVQQAAEQQWEQTTIHHGEHSTTTVTSDDAIESLRSVCSNDANGTLEGIELEIYHCVKNGKEWTYTVQNQFACYPKGCEGYPLERKLTPFWGECSKDGFSPPIESDTESADDIGNTGNVTTLTYTNTNTTTDIPLAPTKEAQDRRRWMDKNADELNPLHSAAAMTVLFFVCVISLMLVRRRRQRRKRRHLLLSKVDCHHNDFTELRYADAGYDDDAEEEFDDEYLMSASSRMGPLAQYYQPQRRSTHFSAGWLGESGRV